MQQFSKRLSQAIRVLGFVGMICLAFTFRGAHDRRIITLSPFSIHTDWYGILGLIGWAYLIGSISFLIFRGHRTALLGGMVLLLCLFPADKKHAFDNFWLARYVGIGETLGSQAAITVGGLLLASILIAADTGTVGARVRFTLLFIAGTAAGALLLNSITSCSRSRTNVPRVPITTSP